MNPEFSKRLVLTKIQYVQYQMNMKICKTWSYLLKISEETDF